ncbi:MAG: energy-coupling factor transporter transmembrane protein EcfT [Chloroflexi bacterium]|nr:energy-coupling factor transporter transmembrane protein EcfT [Chloroflexota bacterium]
MWIQQDFHPYAWALWLAQAATAALVTRNPFYLAVLIVAGLFLFATLSKRRRRLGDDHAAAARPATWAPILKLAFFLMLFSILFNALTVHYGDRILFHLPESWPLIGGPITLEALIYGLVMGMGFFALLLVFSVFNSAVGPQTLLRMAPNFMHQAGVALTIAVSFIPQTLIAYQEIREAQRLRGHVVRGLRDFQPLFVSLLAIGLDRAIQLAESMDARGFGGNLAALDARGRRRLGLATLAGLSGLLVGLLLRAMQGPGDAVGLGLMAGGAIALLLVFREQGRRLQRTRYRRWLWRPRDTALAAALTPGLVALLGLALLAPNLLFYYPYPPYALTPDFNPIIALLFALPLLPALLLPGKATAMD